MRQHLAAFDIRGWVEEHRFHDTRRWRFDFAWPELMLALELEGGTHAGGRHVRGAGFEKDCEKYNQAACMGWLVLRATSAMVRDGRALSTLEEALETLGAPNGVAETPSLLRRQAL